MNLLLALVFMVLLLYSISIIFVFAWGMITSLKSEIDFKDLGNYIGLPNFEWSKNEIFFGNYLAVFTGFNGTTIPDQSYYSSLFGLVTCEKVYVTFGSLVFNSVMYAVVGTGVYVLTCMTVAFICAKYKLKICEIIYNLVVVVMIIPIGGNYASSISVMKDLGLYNSYLGMIVNRMSFTGMYFLIFHAFLQGVPDSFIEAAEIDGASQLSVYLKIILPLSTKIMGTVWLLMFIDAWNNYSSSIMYYPSLRVLAAAVYLVSYGGVRTIKGAPAQISAAMIMAIPLILLFIVFRNKILGEISMGGLKE
jgi:ABC-type glycerol-3-phosphate transport system permease component